MSVGYVNTGRRTLQAVTNVTMAGLQTGVQVFNDADSETFKTVIYPKVSP